MKSPGINYGGSTTNIDPESGIRYGVIAQNSVHPEALDDIIRDGRDLAWEEAMKELKQQYLNSGEPEDEYDEDDVAEKLGYTWETNISNMLYEEHGYKVTGCLDTDLMVIKSPYFTYAPFCSPCVPGAGNLDSAPTPPEWGVSTHEEMADLGFPRVYCLGHDWFEDNQAPYVVFSVATGELVNPEGKA